MQDNDNNNNEPKRKLKPRKAMVGMLAIFMGLLELLVAFIQAYVFTLLSALYFGMATEEHH